MSNVVCNRFKQQSMVAGVNLTSQTINCALLSNIFVSSVTQLSDVQSFSSIQAQWEASGTAYVTGGQALSATGTVEDDVGNKSIFSAANVTWSTATITAYGAMLYRASDSFPICFVDFGGAKTSTAGDFTIQWNAAGIINLT